MQTSTMTIVTFYTQEYRDIGELNSTKWELYCKLHDYKWICHTPGYLVIHPYWQKSHYIVESLHCYNDTVVWADIDVSVKKLSFDLNDVLMMSQKDILISSDPNGLCAGFMVIRNTSWARSFFETIINLGDVEFKKQRELYFKPLGDQNTIKYLYDGFESVKNHIHFLDQSIVSCPETDSPNAPFHH